jgi:hypothetical protein
MPGASRGWSYGLYERTERTQQRAHLVRGHPRERTGEQLVAEHFALAAQGGLPGWGQPDQRPAPAGRGSPRPVRRQVLQHSQRGVRQLAARRVPPVEGQVHGPEESLKLPGWLSVAAHQARLPNLLSIVNPDTSQLECHPRETPRIRPASPGRCALASAQRWPASCAFVRLLRGRWRGTRYDGPAGRALPRSAPWPLGYGWGGARVRSASGFRPAGRSWPTPEHATSGVLLAHRIRLAATSGWSEG